jgi:beta-1,4-mannosyl-glycoprotein beta-1,4-N-acetylglucosaminyltransferase
MNKDNSKKLYFTNYIIFILFIYLFGTPLVQKYTNFNNYLPINTTYTSFQNSRQLFDIVWFNDELDMLEIRIRELWDQVDIFFILESNSTFSGKSKPLHLQQNWMRFEHFFRKMIRVELPGQYSNNAFNVEWDARSKGLQLAFDQYHPKRDDLILLSDLDEIPKSTVLQIIKNETATDRVIRLSCDFYYYGFQFLSPTTWQGPIITVYTDPATFPTGAKLRGLKYWNTTPIRDIRKACWHCSWCFSNISLMINKAQSYSHTEHNNAKYLNKQWIIHHVRNGNDLFDRKNQKYALVSNNQDIPKFILNNKERFSYLLNRTDEKAGFLDA